MEIRNLTNKEYKDYDNFVMKHEHSMFYHSIKYKNFLEQITECESKYYIAFDGKKINGVLPTFEKKGKLGTVINSLPFFGSNGSFLTLNEDAETLLMKELLSISNRSDVCSTLLVGNPLKVKQPEFSERSICDSRISQWTDISCDNDLDIFNSFDSSTRRNIRKAKKENITVEVNNNAFLELKSMHETGIYRINGITKPEKFFKIVPDVFVADDDYKIYTAKRNGKIISALLLFYFKDMVEYFVPATLLEERNKQPLPLIIYEAMKDAMKNNFKKWNWGGTWLSQEGVYRFKKKFNAKDKSYHYYNFVNNIEIFNSTPQVLLENYEFFYTVPFKKLCGSIE